MQQKITLKLSIIGILDPQHVTETDCWWCLLTQVCIQCIQFMFQYVHIYIYVCLTYIYILMFVAKSLVILFAFCFPLQVQAAPAEALAIYFRSNDSGVEAV